MSKLVLAAVCRMQGSNISLAKLLPINDGLLFDLRPSFALKLGPCHPALGLMSMLVA